MENLETIHWIISQRKIPLKDGQNSRRGFPRHRATTLGLVRQRGTYKIALSAYSKLNPLLYDLIFELGREICPHSFTSVHINHNVICPRHRDSKNQGNSTIIAFGDYSGGELYLEDGRIIDIRRPFTFNGSQIEHWNEGLSGEKYSLVFFSVNEKDKKKVVEINIDNEVEEWIKYELARKEKKDKKKNKK